MDREYKLAVVCASNQNRSMEAHNTLRNHGYNCSSFGTGSAVRLPGPTRQQPNVYKFGVPYNVMYNDLYRKDVRLYTQNGILNMLDRNRKIKLAPEKFQDNQDQFEVVITCEERVFDAALEDILNKSTVFKKPVHVINVEIIDNHEQALIGGQLILQLVEMIYQTGDLDHEMDILLEEFRQKTKASVLYSYAVM
ncbi:RNA polymerase II subunit A C-terminal domain phosphatase [Boothiomyces sp. JEL0866]|nr:RNA polymerase II subunit A C-terminal domain phosphatase [Boothiomyces sp. JEL0866]